MCIIYNHSFVRNIIPYICKVSSIDYKQKKSRKELFTYVCTSFTDHIFTPCTENEGKDVCVPCEQGRFMPDIIDSSEWQDYSPFCLPNDCDQCDSTGTVKCRKNAMGKGQKINVRQKTRFM